MIIDFIHKGQKIKLDLIKNKLIDLASTLADNNEFLLHLSRHRGKKSVVGVKLKKLIDSYAKGLRGVEIKAFLQYINNNYPITYFKLKELKSISDVFICDLVMEDVRNFYPKIGDYVNISASSSRVASNIKNLVFNDDGLVLMDENFNLERQHIIYENKYKLYYHQYLRRGFSGNFTDITTYLKQVSIQKDIKLSLALDPYRLTEELRANEIMELDHWYGPKFNKSKLNDRNFIGLTVHVRDENDVRNINKPILRTEFFVSNTKDNKKAIEIEEIVPTKVKSEYTLQKYTHILWDKDKNAFVHFDPAVKIYKKDEHTKRVDYRWKPKNVNLESRCKKIKMFRMDGLIDIELTMNILGDYYRDNELVHEYFETDK